MKYSVEEIDDMRLILRKAVRPPSSNTILYGPSREMDWDNEAEDQLRTYMSNGTSVEELEKKLGRK